MKDIKLIMDFLTVEGTNDYKCYDTLKQLLQNDSFYNVILEGIRTKKILPYSIELWEKLKRQNIRAKGVNSFLEVLRDGYNQGYCTVASKQVSYSLDKCYICGGTLPILAGTTNCKDGSHTWIEYGNFIIDTTLMIMIDESYADKIGYIEENRYNPNDNPIYIAAKEYTNDVNLRAKSI